MLSSFPPRGTCGSHADTQSPRSVPSYGTAEQAARYGLKMPVLGWLNLRNCRGCPGLRPGIFSAVPGGTAPGSHVHPGLASWAIFSRPCGTDLPVEFSRCRASFPRLIRALFAEGVCMGQSPCPWGERAVGNRGLGCCVTVAIDHPGVPRAWPWPKENAATVEPVFV